MQDTENQEPETATPETDTAAPNEQFDTDGAAATAPDAEVPLTVEEALEGIVLGQDELIEQVRRIADFAEATSTLVLQIVDEMRRTVVAQAAAPKKRGRKPGKKPAKRTKR